MRVRQIIRYLKNGTKQELRYNVTSQLCYRQNRSHDRTLSLDAFIEALKTTKDHAKDEGIRVTDMFIDDSKKWEV